MAKSKERATMFTGTEQHLLFETNEKVKYLITKKGNTAAVNKTRDIYKIYKNNVCVYTQLSSTTVCLSKGT